MNKREMSVEARLKKQDSRPKRQEAGRAAWVRGLSSVVCRLWTVLFGLVLAGCAGQQRSEVATEQVCFANLTRAAAMEAAEDVLSRMHFVVEKSDAETGLVRTRPLPGAQFFELWRKDSVGAFNWGEANLHSIQRTVELDIGSQDDRLCIGCDVKVERLNLPEQEVSSSARAYAMFSASSASLQRIRLNPEQEAGMAWVEVGRDKRLTTEILKRIEKQIAKLQEQAI